MNKVIIEHKPFSYRLKKDIKKNWALYLIFLPVFVFFFIFNYIPMGGVLMAFQKYDLRGGIFGSPWVGLDNFATLFGSTQAMYALRNTFAMALLNLTVGFMIPVIFALLVSQVKWKPFRRVTQSISYMPNFVAAVVICTLLQEFLSADGAITQIFVKLFGMEEKNLLAINSPTFWVINCLADVWQGCGYGAIVFIAAIGNVNQDMHEAAAIDGASRVKRIFHITIPAIWPTVVTMLTLKVGLVFKAGFDKILLIYMPSTYQYSDVLTTFIYRFSFSKSIDYGLSTALGLFQSVVSMVLLVLSNWLNKAVTKTSLF